MDAIIKKPRNSLQRNEDVEGQADELEQFTSIKRYREIVRGEIPPGDDFAELLRQLNVTRKQFEADKIEHEKRTAELAVLKSSAVDQARETLAVCDKELHELGEEIKRINGELLAKKQSIESRRNKANSQLDSVEQIRRKLIFTPDVLLDSLAKQLQEQINQIMKAEHPRMVHRRNLETTIAKLNGEYKSRDVVERLDLLGRQMAAINSSSEESRKEISRIRDLLNQIDEEKLRG